jgi:hypothetical protein
MGMELIEHIEVGSGGAASIEFTGIPQDGVSLVLKLSLRNQSAAALLRANNVSAADSYSDLRLLGIGSTTSTAISTAGTTQLSFGIADYSGLTANTFSSHEVIIANYATTTTFKSLSADSVAENNATEAYQVIAAGLIKNNNAITSLSILEQGANLFLQYTTASLYKITAD